MFSFTVFSNTGAEVEVKAYSGKIQMQRDTPATGTLSALRDPRRPPEGDCVGHRTLVPSFSGTNFVCMAHTRAHIEPLGNAAKKVLQGLLACFLSLRIHVLAVVQVSASEACEPTLPAAGFTRPGRGGHSRSSAASSRPCRLGWGNSEAGPFRS